MDEEEYVLLMKGETYVEGHCDGLTSFGDTVLCAFHDWTLNRK